MVIVLVKPREPFKWTALEIGYLSFIAFYGVVFFAGKTVNKRIAQALYGHITTYYCNTVRERELDPILNKNFAQVGEAESPRMVRETFSSFSVTATGRVNTVCTRFNINVCTCLVSIKLRINSFVNAKMFCLGFWACFGLLVIQLYLFLPLASVKSRRT